MNTVFQHIYGAFSMLMFGNNLAATSNVPRAYARGWG